MPKILAKPIHYLDPFSIHHALCTLAIAVLAFSFLYYFPTPQASWFLLSCLLFSQAGLSTEATWQASWKTLFYLVCGLLAASLVLLISLCAFQFFPTAALLFVISLVAGYLGWRKRQYFFAAFVITLFTLLAAFSPANFGAALERFYLIVLGSFIVMALRFFYFIYQQARAAFYAQVVFFQKLIKLYQLIFFYSSGPSSRSMWNQELEESHFQIAWSDCLSALRIFKAKTTPAYGAHLDRIWDLTLSLGSLRYRLTDFTVLTMSQNEMQALLKALLAILDKELSSPSDDPDQAVFETLQNAIQGFEELYRSMLQTVAKEPLVLLLFIQDLYALKEEFEQLALIENAGRRL